MIRADILLRLQAPTKPDGMPGLCIVRQDDLAAMLEEAQRMHTQIEAWRVRLRAAESRSTCSICHGTGQSYGPHHFGPCIPCRGAGRITEAATPEPHVPTLDAERDNAGFAYQHGATRHTLAERLSFEEGFVMGWNRREARK